MKSESTALNEAIRRARGMSELARRLGLTRQAIFNWRTVPATRVLAVEKATGVPRHRLRPDVYPKPE